MENLLHPDGLSRRVFVKGLGFVSVGLVLAAFGGCDQLADAIKNRPTRRRLRTGSPEVDADIATYKQAVSLMKGLPASDLRSWANQAAIHGTVAGGFNFCQHGTPHFFDWHRAFLLYFERICQKLTGNDKFGLPYWNWNQDPDIHPAFLDASSTLFQTRTRTSMTGSPSITTADLDPIFADTNFFTFATQIEGTPHNNVHTFIGGIMGGGGSAGDPLFWVHHCMVDYCWAKWNIELGNNNTNDATWNNTVNSHFVDTDQNPVTATAAITTIMPLLSYQYESSAIGSSPAEAAVIKKQDFEKLQARIKAGADVRFDIKQRIPIAERAAITVGKPFSKETRLAPGDLAALINNDAAKEKIFASIEYAQLPSTASDYSVRVFIDLPGANMSTPTSDPHYAGNFTFFGTEPTGDHQHDHQPPRFLVNITGTLQKLKRAGELKEGSPVTVQLVAIPFSGKFEREESQLVLDRVEIIVTPVIVNAR